MNLLFLTVEKQSEVKNLQLIDILSFQTLNDCLRSFVFIPVKRFHGNTSWSSQGIVVFSVNPLWRFTHTHNVLTVSLLDTVVSFKISPILRLIMNFWHIRNQSLSSLLLPVNTITLSNTSECLLTLYLILLSFLILNFIFWVFPFTMDGNLVEI